MTGVPPSLGAATAGGREIFNFVPSPLKKLLILSLSLSLPPHLQGVLLQQGGEGEDQLSGEHLVHSLQRDRCSHGSSVGDPARTGYRCLHLQAPRTNARHQRGRGGHWLR